MKKYKNDWKDAFLGLTGTLVVVLIIFSISKLNQIAYEKGKNDTTTACNQDFQKYQQLLVESIKDNRYIQINMTEGLVTLVPIQDCRSYNQMG